MKLRARFLAAGLGISMLTAGMISTTRACTIFVLTDDHQALFCNNEDYSNPNTRIWFIPGGGGRYGCVYVGFDNGWAQGGMNSEGLAFDWVAGYDEKWEPDPAMQTVLGNPSRSMLESCSNVDQAIEFYRSHRERSFSYAKTLIADRTGASVIIGAKDGHLQFEKLNQTRGFGFGRETLAKLLSESPAPSVDNGGRIMRACVQSGQFATKYSNIYDLKSGDVYLFPDPVQNQFVKINLSAELKKGAHYFDMHQIREQEAQPVRPLQDNMKAMPLEIYKPVPDKEPEMAKRVRRMLQDALDGKMREEDFAPATWQGIQPASPSIQRQLISFGPLASLTLVDRGTKDTDRSYRYRVEFQKATLLMHFVLNAQDKVTVCDTEAMQ
jgi:hypothetical protein